MRIERTKLYNVGGQEMKNVYADYYYNFLIGEHPNEKDYRTTSLTMNHLKDAGFSEVQLFRLLNAFPVKDKISFEDIPNSLWEGSCLERNKFYFHKELQILSPPPTWDETFEFYLEMKIQYSLDEALDYFIKRSGTREEWVNRDREIGSIKFLLKEYKKFDFMEPLDFLLHLIDYAISCGAELNSIYDIRRFEIELATYLEIDVANAVSMNKNRVIWRS
jgi:hypothetical protein